MAYKPSDIEWLGDVPAHWEVVQLGRIGRFSKGSGGTKADEVPEGVPCIRYGDLYTSHRFHIRASRSCVSEAVALNYTPLRYGDILFAGSGETIEEIGKSAVNLIDQPACCGGDVILFRPERKIDARFSGYAIGCPQSQYQKSCMGRGITVMHIYGDELKNLWMALPPLAEQRAIACYLDHVDRRIQRYIEAKEKLITLLQEARQAIIQSVVTRGLDPDVSLKPSGLPWLPYIPAHWHTERGKRLFTKMKRPVRDSDEVVTCFRDGAVTLRKNRRTEGFTESLQEIGYQGIRAGDLVIHAMDAFAGAIGVADSDGKGTPVYSVCRPAPHADAYYFAYILREMARNQWIAALATGIRERSTDFRYATMASQWLPLPPTAEQRAIVAHLDQATEAIDSAIDNARRQSERMTEYRASLIAHVVTGKLDVRAAAEQLPQEARELAVS